jgi:hypothetical protein
MHVEGALNGTPHKFGNANSKPLAPNLKVGRANITILVCIFHS